MRRLKPATGAVENTTKRVLTPRKQTTNTKAVPVLIQTVLATSPGRLWLLTLCRINTRLIRGEGGGGKASMMQGSQGSPAGPPGRSGIKMKIYEEDVQNGDSSSLK